MLNGKPLSKRRRRTLEFTKGDGTVYGDRNISIAYEGDKVLVTALLDGKFKYTVEVPNPRG